MTERADPEPAPDSGSTSALSLIELLLEGVGLIAFVAMMVITLLQVAVRYLEISLDWTEELARILFLAAIMIGVALAIRRRQHIVVDVVFANVSRPIQTALSLAFDALTLLLLAIWLQGAVRLAILNAGTTFVTVPWLPVSLLYAVEAVGIGLMIVFVLADLTQRWSARSSRQPSP